MDKAEHQNESQCAAYSQKDARKHDPANTKIALLMPFLYVPAGLSFEFIHVLLPASLQTRDRSRVKANACPAAGKRRTARFRPWQWDKPQRPRRLPGGSYSSR